MRNDVLIVLGLARDVHDPSAALVMDGRIVAAAEEERFTRVKHAPATAPVRSASFCLRQAGLTGRDVDIVAYPWSMEAYRRNRWIYAARTFGLLPRHAARAILRTRSRWAREMRAVRFVARALDIDPGRTRFEFVPHHLAHAASAYLAAGLEKALVLTADAMGEYDSAGAWTAEGARMEKMWELLLPHSLGTFYTAVTEYLGFEPNDGEYKTMGLAGYGDPGRADLSAFCRLENGIPAVDPRAVFPPRRFRGSGRYYARSFEEILGPPGSGNVLEGPYRHIAARAQEIVEEGVLSWLRGPLETFLRDAGGTLCLAGGVALNVRLNGRILEEPGVSRLWVQPCSGDAGGSMGAALWASTASGYRAEPMDHAFLGPAFGEAEIRSLLEARRLPYRRMEHPARELAEILSDGEILGRFDGPMEWGPRALGNRSILAHPGIGAMADRINEAVKFREGWRPFCPSVLAERAGEIFAGGSESPFMTVNRRVDPAWTGRIGEVVHIDGTARIQTVDRWRIPAFHGLLRAFEERTGLPVLLNTSLNRRGEPIACTPQDALAVFFGSGLDRLALGPFLLSKQDFGCGCQMSDRKSGQISPAR